MWESEWPLYPREHYLSQLRATMNSPFIKVIAGLRRTGKSTIMDMFRTELTESGIPAENIFYRRIGAGRLVSRMIQVSPRLSPNPTCTFQCIGLSNGPWKLTSFPEWSFLWHSLQRIRVLDLMSCIRFTQSGVCLPTYRSTVCFRLRM